MGFWDALLGRSPGGNRGGRSGAGGVLGPTRDLGQVSTTPQAPGTGFVVLDVETTGLSPRQHRILEIALVATDTSGRATGEWCTRLNPGGPVGATHIHGITAADVRNAPRFPDVLPTIVEWMSGRAVVAHNAKFDLAFLRSEFLRAGWQMPFPATLCTLEASWYYLPQLDRRRLTDCCWATGIRLEASHSALGDARATSVLLRSYLDPGFGRIPLREHRDLPEEAAGIAWPAAPSDARAAPYPADGSPRSSAGPNRGSPRVAVAMQVLLDSYATSDALQEGAPTVALTYLETLAEALEDGELSDEERKTLDDLAAANGLDDRGREAAHKGFLAALARHAVEDGLVSRAERNALNAAADLLAVDRAVVSRFVDSAAMTRLERLSQACQPLPDDWGLGEPLRVGDRVVFTGCEPSERGELERKAELSGVRVMGGVSRSTAMLVADGGFVGTKAQAAKAIGLRTVTPTVFAQLLRNIQPVRRSGVQGAAPPSGAGATPQSVLSRYGTGSGRASYQPADVRAWARIQGLEVGTRGRLSAEVIAAFEASMARSE